MAELEPDPNRPLRLVGRYALYGQLAAGGMATVHFGRLLGPVGFSRTVAIKRLHPQFAKDPEFVAMFLDEARLAARIRHPNVVATVDVVAMEEELFLVMEYIRGESFSRLLRGARRQNLELPEGFIANVVASMLHGLHAAHEATDERGQPLHVVHRDVSPQNVLVGTDGVPRVLDFGVAKAAARIQVTRDGQMKGKLAYMSPEQLSGASVDRRCDVFASGVVLWEALTGERLFTGDDASQVLTKILREPIPPPSSVNPRLRRNVDDVVMHALDKNPATRFQTAREFAVAVEDTMQLMSPRAVGEWVERVAGESLAKRERALAEIESISSVNELSQMTPSDPGFMRTLKTQVRGHNSVPLRPQLPSNPARPQVNLRPSMPGRAPPMLRASRPLLRASRSPPPKPTAVADAEDAATTVYQTAAGPAPPLPGDAFAPAEPPRVIISDPEPEETGIGANPFRTETPWRPYVVWAGGGTLAVSVLYFLFSALFALGESSVQKPTLASKPEVKEQPGPDPFERTEAVDPSELPVAEEPEPDEPDEPESERAGEPTRKSTSSSKPSSGGSKPRPGGTKKPAKAACQQPWYVDAQGIRRIKAECL